MIKTSEIVGLIEIEQAMDAIEERVQDEVDKIDARAKSIGFCVHGYGNQVS